MKGLTAQLRDLGAGEQIEVAGVARSDIHKIAKRIGCGVRVSKFVNGFYVTKIGGVRKDEVTENAPAPKQSIDDLRALIAGIGSGPKIEVTTEDAWIEDPQTFENGEILYWHHKPKCKPVCYRRESDFTAA